MHLVVRTSARFAQLKKRLVSTLLWHFSVFNNTFRNTLAVLNLQQLEEFWKYFENTHGSGVWDIYWNRDLGYIMRVVSGRKPASITWASAAVPAFAQASCLSWMNSVKVDGRSGAVNRLQGLLYDGCVGWFDVRWEVDGWTVVGGLSTHRHINPPLPPSSKLEVTFGALVITGARAPWPP